MKQGASGVSLGSSAESVSPEPPRVDSVQLEKANALIWSNVAMEYEGRTLLGHVRGAYPDGSRLFVNHFNGERWPIDPEPDAVIDLSPTAFQKGSP